MITVRIFSVETLLVEKVSGRIYKGNPFIKIGTFFMKIDPVTDQLENPTHLDWLCKMKYFNFVSKHSKLSYKNYRISIIHTEQQVL